MQVPSDSTFLVITMNSPMDVRSVLELGIPVANLASVVLHLDGGSQRSFGDVPSALDWMKTNCQHCRTHLVSVKSSGAIDQQFTMCSQELSSLTL